MRVQWEMILNEVGSWPKDRQDEYYERCGIVQFDGEKEMTRENAEIRAFQQMQRAMRK